MPGVGAVRLTGVDFEERLSNGLSYTFSLPNEIALGVDLRRVGAL